MRKGEIEMLGAVACERAGMRMSARVAPGGHADERDLDDGRCGWAKVEGWDEDPIG